VRVSAATFARYDMHVKSFERWLRDNFQIGGEVLFAREPKVVDTVLQAYVQYLYDEQAPLAHGTYTLAGLQHFHTHIRGQIKGAWGSLREWRIVTPTEVRTPLPVEVLEAMLCTCMVWRWYRTAAILWLGFHCLLRPGEAGGALRHHLVLENDSAGMRSSGVLALPTTKTMNRGSKIQSVLIEDASLLAFLKEVVGRDAPNVLLCPRGLQGLTRCFHLLLVQLVLAVTKYTLGCLRGGGAVEYFRRTHKTWGLSNTADVGTVQAPWATTCRRASRHWHSPASMIPL